jgi:hypothetical protein
MAGKGSYESTPLKVLQRYHHTTLNNFGDGETLVEAMHRRPGCYGPNPTAFLSLLARRPGLTLGDLDEALINDRSLVRATAFRGSMFLLPTDDYPIYFRAFFETLSTAGMSRLRSEGIDEAAIARFSDRLREDDSSAQRSEKQLLPVLYPGKEKRPTDDVLRMLLRKLCDIGVLVRTTCKGWKGNQFQYALTKHWLEGVELVVDNVEAARLEVVRRYLRAYGPARFEDIVWWTGLPAAEVRTLLEQLGREVVRFLVDGLGEGLLTLREVADSTRKGGLAIAERILFLPLWDAYPLGWRDRTRVVDPRFASWVYDPQGNTTSLIVEEGRAIGLWQFRDGDTVTLEFHLFEPYNNRLNAVRLAAEAHAADLMRVSGARDLRVVERALPVPLAERPTHSFMWPLGKDPIFRHSDSDYESPMDRRERTPNVLRSKFLDDERLVRPMLEEEVRRAQRAAAREKTSTLEAFSEHRPEAETASTSKGGTPKGAVDRGGVDKGASSTASTKARNASKPPQPASAPTKNASRPPMSSSRSSQPPQPAAATAAAARKNTTKPPAAASRAAQSDKASSAPRAHDKRGTNDKKGSTVARPAAPAKRAVTPKTASAKKTKEKETKATTAAANRQTSKKVDEQKPESKKPESKKPTAKKPAAKPTTSKTPARKPAAKPAKKPLKKR